MVKTLSDILTAIITNTIVHHKGADRAQMNGQGPSQEGLECRQGYAQQAVAESIVAYCPDCKPGEQSHLTEVTQPWAGEGRGEVCVAEGSPSLG